MIQLRHALRSRTAAAITAASAAAVLAATFAGAQPAGARATLLHRCFTLEAATS